MSKKEQNLWKERDLSYSSSIEAARSRGEACIDYIMGCLCPSDASKELEKKTTLLWAIAMVKSRSHAFGTKRGYWLTPIFDMLNYSPTPNAKLANDAGGNLVLKAIKPVQPGDEITIDYQVSSDPILLANYGFSLVSWEKDNEK